MLLAIMIAAVVARVVAAVVQGDAVTVLPGIYDQVSYDILARRLLAGQGFSFDRLWWPLTQPGEPTAHWSFLYTLYLAAVYELVGPHPLAARLIQAVVAGILYPLFAWRLGRRLSGDTAGLVAAATTVIYAYFVYYAGALMTETFYILGILWALDAALRIDDARRLGPIPRRLWLELGLAAGLTVLLRQLFLLFMPFLYGWLWLTGRRSQVAGRRGARARDPQATNQPTNQPTNQQSLLSGLTLATVVITLLILPFTVRNYLAFDQFVLLNTNSGFAFFWANHPVHGTSFQAILPADGPSYQELIPPELRGLDEPSMERALLGQGLGFVFDDIPRYLMLSISRVKDYFMFWPSPESSTLSNVARVGSFGLFLPFMLYGIWTKVKAKAEAEYKVKAKAEDEVKAEMASGSTSTSTSTSSLTLYLTFVVVYTAIHLLSWALIRYRLPVDALLVLFAAAGLTDLWRRLRVRRAAGAEFTGCSP